MGAVLSYSIGVGICLLVLFIAYKWLLASENQPRLNRVALIAIYLLSFILPLLSESVLTVGASGQQGVGLIGIGVPGVRIIGDRMGQSLWLSILVWVYVAGMVVTAAATVATALKLFFLVRSGQKKYADGYTIVYIDRHDIAPFSWGRYIVMDMDEEGSCSSMIETHELAHIRACHFIDLLISQFTCVFLWYNPASWLMQSELKAVHEYEADDSVLRSGCNARDYQLLLVKKAVGQRFPSLANSLNHSKLKKRITMMYSKKSSVARKSRVLALVPAAALGILLLNVPTVSEAMSTASSANLSLSPAGNDKVTTNSKTVQNNTDNEVFEVVEEMPDFEGGMKAMHSFLYQNLKYPEDAMAGDISGRVIVQFVVTKDGQVEDVHVLRSVSPSLDAEALRVVKATSGKWIPGKVNGKNVNAMFTLPVQFTLTSGDK